MLRRKKVYYYLKMLNKGVSDIFGSMSRISKIDSSNREWESTSDKKPSIDKIPETYEKNNTRKLLYTMKSLKRDDWIRERRRRKPDA